MCAQATTDPSTRLPKACGIQLILGQQSLTFSEASDGAEPPELSYFNVIGWGHSSKSLRLVEALPDESTREWRFRTQEGAAVVADLEVYCRAILADMQAQEAEKRLADKEKEWDEFVAMREAGATQEGATEEEFTQCPSPLTSPSRRAEWVAEFSPSPRATPASKVDRALDLGRAEAA